MKKRIHSLFLVTPIVLFISLFLFYSPRVFAASSSEINSRLIGLSTNPNYYFSTSGNDSNNGLSPDSPKYDPFPYIKNGNANIFLKSGDVYTIGRTIAVGSNTNINSYGSGPKATISLEHKNSSPFTLYDSNNKIYCAKLDAGISDIGYIRISSSGSPN